MVNFGPLTAEIGLRVWEPEQILTGFACWLRLASLLHRRRSTEVNQTLQDVWPSLGLVHSINIFGSCCCLTECCNVQNSLCIQLLRSPTLAALLHGTRAVGASQTAAFSKGRRPTFYYRLLQSLVPDIASLDRYSVAFSVSRHLMAISLFPVLPKPEVVFFTAKRWQMGLSS